MAQRKKVSERLQNYVPFISNVDTEVKGRPGWLEIKVSESFPLEKLPVSIRSTHLSDGTLRMLAISALQEAGKTSGMDLLDEIKNGINPHLAEKMVSDLIERTKSKRRQLVLTTHSTVILDYFPEDSIIFLWRDKQGVVHNQALFSIPDIHDCLEYMYPGEVWLNIDENEIIAKLLGDIDNIVCYVDADRDQGSSKDERARLIGSSSHLQHLSNHCRPRPLRQGRDDRRESLASSI